MKQERSCTTNFFFSSKQILRVKCHLSIFILRYWKDYMIGTELFLFHWDVLYLFHKSEFGASVLCIVSLLTIRKTPTIRLENIHGFAIYAENMPYIFLFLINPDNFIIMQRLPYWSNQFDPVIPSLIFLLTHMEVNNIQNSLFYI